MSSHFVSYTVDGCIEIVENAGLENSRPNSRAIKISVPAISRRSCSVSVTPPHPPCALLTDVVRCSAGLTCDDLECEVGERCVMNEATSTPMCVECTRPCYSTTLPGVGTAYQLCGTDGHTYHDWCSVERETCSRRVLVETRHFGPCQRGQSRFNLRHTNADLSMSDMCT